MQLRTGQTDDQAASSTWPGDHPWSSRFSGGARSEQAAVRPERMRTTWRPGSAAPIASLHGDLLRLFACSLAQDRTHRGRCGVNWLAGTLLFASGLVVGYVAFELMERRRVKERFDIVIKEALDRADRTAKASRELNRKVESLTNDVAQFRRNMAERHRVN